MSWAQSPARGAAHITAVARITLASIVGIALAPAVAHAYVGPGAGFAVVGSLGFIFVTFILAFVALITWPFRTAYRAIRSARVRRRTPTRRVIILGLDGLDPDLAQRWMDEGHLPTFKRLAEQGSFHRLATSFPAMSPVAWSCFATGVDAAKHNIFDFLDRDLRTHMPILSSTDIRPPTRTLKIGRYEIPLNKPTLRLLRRSQTFWRLLGERYIPCHVLRVPITFPPEKVPNGVLLSAMCVPDLRGTQGSFTLFTTDRERAAALEGGTVIVLERQGHDLVGSIPGPPDPLTREHAVMKLPLRVKLGNAGGSGSATLVLGKEQIPIRPGAFTDWITLTFRAGLGQKVRGIVRFRVMRAEPQFDLYMTAINLDPESPAMPISTPGFFAQYLARLNGPYATLGLAEDTWALNERVIDEEAFLDYAWQIHDEREKMWFNSLRKNRSGLNVVVFDATDRIQHSFFRYLVDDHPANRGKDTTRYKDVMLDLYRRSDDLLRRTLEFVDEKTVLFVLSDHGFKPFKRGVNLNNWFLEHGYMASQNGGVGRYFDGVDWPKTRAYTFGLGGVYLNVKGRETDGAVAAGEEYRALKAELIEKLTGLRDPESGEIGITRVYDGAEVFHGPYRDKGPDLVVGFAPGYRVSWDGAVGAGGSAVFEDNTKSWSGDHCMDPLAVPGVLFSNRKLATGYPNLMDIGPTTLELFGVTRPAHVDGIDLFNPEQCARRQTPEDAFFPSGVPASLRRVLRPAADGAAGGKE
jgi:predicted AlkP superfamily phosphohydrolase/phosphomutase